MSFALEKNACRYAHDGVCNEVCCGTELALEVAESELGFKDHAKWVLESGHERNHREQEKHYHDRQCVVRFTSLSTHDLAEMVRRFFYW